VRFPTPAFPFLSFFPPPFFRVKPCFEFSLFIVRRRHLSPYDLSFIFFSTSLCTANPTQKVVPRLVLAHPALNDTPLDPPRGLPLLYQSLPMPLRLFVSWEKIIVLIPPSGDFPHQVRTLLSPRFSYGSLVSPFVIPDHTPPVGLYSCVL